MRRTLISYNAFDRIEKDSLSNAAFELTEAQSILGEVLDVEPVALHCYDDENVLFETTDGNYLKATYQINAKEIEFDNIEEVVIDEASHTKARRELLSQMLDSVLDDDDTKASQLFHNYLEMAAPKMKYTKGRKDKSVMEKMVSNVKTNMKHMNEDAAPTLWGKQRTTGTVPKHVRAQRARRGHAENPDAKLESQRKRRIKKAEHKRKRETSAEFKKLTKQRKQRKAAGEETIRVPASTRLESWMTVAHHVHEYADYLYIGPVLAETTVARDDRKNIVSVRIPTSQLRNEGKLLSLKWDTLKVDVKVLREQAMRLGMSEDFQTSVAAIKRHNNLADNEQLEDAIGGLVAQFPEVLYLTQHELAKVTGEALARHGTTNYDDQTCDFIAEGVLRVAFESYPDRVNRLASLAGARSVVEGEDAYNVFQNAVEGFYQGLDEKMAVEMQVFSDLYDVLTEVRRAALESDADYIRSEASNYIEQLESVLNGETAPTIDLAEEVADFVSILVETNLSTRNWDVTKRPYRTTVGEHPDMSKKAHQPYSPAGDGGADAYPGKLSVTDGQKWHAGDDMSKHAWGNVGGKDVYPSVQNPYVPKAGDWTLKYEPGVDKTGNDASGQWGSKDTWPALQNPYVPQSVRKHVGDPNRVDDVESRVGMKQVSDLDQNISG